MTSRIGWRAGRDGVEDLISREWLITNSLGGYASGTLAGVPRPREAREERRSAE